MNTLDLIKNIFFLLLFLYIFPPLVKNVVKSYQNFLEPKTSVAVITIKGALYDATPYIRQLHTYFKDKSIKAILLHMECPGSATGTGESIYNEIIHLKKEYQKPIFTLVENTCASGGYLIACGTDYIIAPGMSLVGSIGVCLPYVFQLRQLLEKNSITYVPLTAGTYKSATDPFTDLTPDQKTILLSMLDDTYEQFKTIVIDNRKLSTKTEKEWADGKIFTGQQALKLGLIDAVGSASTMVKIIKERAMIEGEIEWVKQIKPLSLIKSFLTGEQTDSDSSFIESSLNSLCTVLENRSLTPRL